MKKNAIKYHQQGFSCSESIVKAAVDEGLCDISLLPVATTFSAGMSSGCACGAITGAQLVIGYNFGKENKFGNEPKARDMAKEFVERFKQNNKATCCKILTAEYEQDSAERRQYCENLVAECAEILGNMLSSNVSCL